MNPWPQLLGREGYDVRPAADPEVLERAQADTIPPWPTSLVSVYGACNGVLDLRAQNWVFWPLDELVQENRRLREAFNDFPLDSVAFGYDGFGSPFSVRVDDPGVAHFSPIEGQARIVAPDLEHFWEAWDASTLRL